MSNRLYPFLVISIFLIILSGCKAISSVAAIYNKDVKPQKQFYGDKSVIFVPIVHFGQKEFYDNLKDSVLYWKSNDYTVFYEEIGRTNLDSAVHHSNVLKWRKIKGGMGNTRASYSELQNTFEDKITQPEYNQLGIDSTDINADISFDELINKYEELYGEVRMDSCDEATPLDSTYACGKGLKNDINAITIDYRNESLAKQIRNSQLKKIIVIYGKDHISAVKKILKKEGA